MNKSLALFAAIGTLSALATQAYDGTVTINGTTGTHGGPFSVSITKGPGSGLNNAANSFLTFCLESTEGLRLNRTYDVTVNTGAVNGGANGGNPDPVSAATAWVYKNFLQGNLGAYTGDEVQAVIWKLEGEPSGAVNNTLWLAANAGAALVPADNWGVRAMNLYENLEARQDLLVVVPEPSTYIAGGLALLPLLFGLRSRLAKK